MNVESTMRTNYFHISDVDRFNLILKHITGENSGMLKITTSKGDTLYGFYATSGFLYYYLPTQFESVKIAIANSETIYNSADVNTRIAVPYEKLDEYEELYDADGKIIYCMDEATSDDIDDLAEVIVPLINDDEAIIITEASWEGLRSVDGWCGVYTKKGSAYTSLYSFANATVEKFLGTEAMENLKMHN